MTRHPKDNDRLSSVLENWRAMPVAEKPTLLKTFTAGLNHATYLIAAGGKPLVLKLFNNPSHHAITVQRCAAAHNLAPAVLYVNEHADVALLEYISGNTIAERPNSSELLALANTLRQLHSLSLTEIGHELVDFDLLEFYRTYLESIDPSHPLLSRLQQKLAPIIAQFLEDSTQWCLCHNDLVKENCFIVNQGAQFIDWEYAQPNNPWFDLAAIIYYCRLDMTQSMFFLKAYRRDWELKVTETIFYTSQCALLWADILWHLARNSARAWSDLRPKIDDLNWMVEKLSERSGQ